MLTGSSQIGSPNTGTSRQSVIPLLVRLTLVFASIGLIERQEYVPSGANSMTPLTTAVTIVHCARLPVTPRRAYRMAMPDATAWTVSMLEALPDDGQRYEIIDGVLYVTPAPRVRHQSVVT